jgi:hypothetical protein
MLNRNYDGTLRTVTGWPMGAQAANQGDGLIVWLNFSIYDGSHDVTDASPGGHDGILPHGDAGEDVHTNWPTLVSGPPRNGYQGVSFPPVRYFGITNVNGLNPISSFTICTWYRIPATDANGLSDCTLFDTGLGDQKTNAVHLGRWNSAGFGLWVVANNGFPTNAVPIAADTPGVDTGWHFVAYTFSAGKVVGYFDGVPVGTNTVPCDFVQVVNDDSPYASIGTFTHSRSFNPIDPEGASGPSGSYPNGGFGSQMADFRIYDRVKTAAEIEAIYEGQGAGPSNPPPPPNTCVIVTTNTTPFTNIYDATMLLTLTAPKIVGSKTFSEWRQDNSSFTNGQSAIVDLTADHSMEAVYTNTPNDLGRRFFKVKRK